jgi:hypothetical protein
MITLFEIQARAATDPDFRGQLLDDPRAALAESGVELPETTDVQIRQSPAGTLVLSLPPVLDHALTEGELADAAAGVGAAAAVNLAFRMWGGLTGLAGGAAAFGTVKAIQAASD